MEIYTFQFLFEVLLIAAVALDLVFGDPQWFPHPVRMIGILCEKIEQLSRKVFPNEKISGIIGFWVVLVVSGSVTTALLLLSFIINVWFSLFVAVVLLYFFIAIKDLFFHSRKVYEALVLTKNLDNARRSLSNIVGRDTKQLDEKHIVKACVETVSENMADGITAPLFWAAIFSLLSLFFSIDPIFFAVLGMALYKAINTMDSMWGYKNDRYLHFGKMAAKIDDIVNFFPARISAFFIVISAFFLGLDTKRSLRILLRDRLNHTSPNSAHTEAATAGALGIELGGPSPYFGKIVEKPCIGDPVREPQAEDILVTNRLVFLSTLVFLVFLLGARILFLQIINNI